MATKAQMTALLATNCRWCGAQAGEKCRVRIGKRLLAVPSTLDGESHDTRWHDALGMSARVLSAGDARFKLERVDEDREPKQVAVLDRPW